MAGTGRQLVAYLSNALRRQGNAISFFKAIRLFERAARIDAGEGSRKGSAGIGGEALPGDEPVRLRVDVGLGFPEQEIRQIRPGTDDGSPELTVSFMGLTGPSGILPQWYSERMVERQRARDDTMAAFFDLFNHRTVSLFYRAWQKYKMPINYERHGAGASDPISRVLRALVGIEGKAFYKRLGAQDEMILAFSGPFSSAQPRAMSLKIMLTQLLDLPVEIEEFVGNWVNIATDEQTRLPSPADPRGKYCGLGTDSIVGARYWECQSRFRIKIGAMGIADFRRFFEDDGPFSSVVELTRLYVGPAMNFDVQLVLKKGEVPNARLAGDVAAPRLGQNGWLYSNQRLADADEAVLRAD